jgi:hypothetical protein
MLVKYCSYSIDEMKLEKAAKGVSTQIKAKFQNLQDA